MAATVKIAVRTHHAVSWTASRSIASSFSGFSHTIVGAVRREMIVATVRHFVEQEIYPHEGVVGQSGHVPPELAERLGTRTVRARENRWTGPADHFRRASTCEGCTYWQPPQARRDYAEVPSFTTVEMEAHEHLLRRSRALEGAIVELDRGSGFTLRDEVPLHVYERLLPRPSPRPSA